MISEKQNPTQYQINATFKAKQDFKADNDPEYSTSKNNAVSAKRASEIF